MIKNVISKIKNFSEKSNNTNIKISNSNSFIDNVKNVFSNRRNTIQFDINPINEKDIVEIIQHANCFPKAMKIQNYNVIIVRDKKKIKDIASCLSGKYIFLENSKCVFVVIRDDSKLVHTYGKKLGNKYSQQNSISFINNIQILCEFYGYGNYWIREFEEKNLRNILDVGINFEIDGIIPIGISKDKEEKCMTYSDCRTMYWDTAGMENFSERNVFKNKNQLI